jgi:hypothetical protein
VESARAAGQGRVGQAHICLAQKYLSAHEFGTSSRVSGRRPDIEAKESE